MDKKKSILELIKKEKEIATNRVAGMLGINTYYAERYLNELKEEGKIESFSKGSFVYWRLKEK